MAIALRHSRAKGTTKVVMIGIANHDGDGGSWPSIDTLADYANVDPRTVQRSIDQLVKLGEVRRIIQGGGTHLMADSHRPNLYEVLLRCPVDCDRTAQHRTKKQLSRPRPSPLEGLAGELGVIHTGDASVTPDLSTGVTPMSPGGVTPVSPKPVPRTHHSSPRDNSSSRASASAVRPTMTWIDERCPGNWRDHSHVLSKSTGKCAHCFEPPTMNAATGEVA
ncbi:helix-turn-helix domain-containing protein [Microbacterium sp. NPDC087665]|uniref:helix-turn-helix domain-containing protein n=1 Tax=Microbacterium sp. NPDC087665 TaxID=3364194 RepID=UPI0037FCAD75